MSLYILDTDILTLLEEGHPAVGQRFLQQRREDVAVTVLSVEEQFSSPVMLAILVEFLICKSRIGRRER